MNDVDVGSVLPTNVANLRRIKLSVLEKYTHSIRSVIFPQESGHPLHTLLLTMSRLGYVDFNTGSSNEQLTKIRTHIARSVRTSIYIFADSGGGWLCAWTFVLQVFNIFIRESSILDNIHLFPPILRLSCKRNMVQQI